MISSILTALGVAALSIQTPSNIQPQEPKRAYYDSSAVASYGNTAGHWYSYVSTTLYGASFDEEWYTDQINVDTGLFDTSTSTHNNYFGLNNANETASYGSDICSETIVSIDVYINGTFSSTITLDQTLEEDSVTLEGYYSNKLSYAPEEFPNPSYVWLFDHEETNMSETIAEVVGDATTAAGAVLGSGISGAIALFYNEGITGLGIIALILTGVSLVWFAFSLVLRLWRRR